MLVVLSMVSWHDNNNSSLRGKLSTAVFLWSSGVRRTVFIGNRLNAIVCACAKRNYLVFFFFFYMSIGICNNICFSFRWTHRQLYTEFLKCRRAIIISQNQHQWSLNLKRDISIFKLPCVSHTRISLKNVNFAKPIPTHTGNVLLSFKSFYSVFGKSISDHFGYLYALSTFNVYSLFSVE